MTSKRVSFSFQKLLINEIESYYVISEKALRTFYQSSDHHFVGYTLDELDEELDNYIDELDKSCAFTVLAAIEAHLRVDYLQRCYNKEKDNLSRDFRALYKNKGTSVSLSDDILALWAKYLLNKSSISELRSALHYRDWLAHGRYWVARLGRSYDFNDLLTLAIFLQEELDVQMGT